MQRVTLIGLAGSGKSVIGRQLVERFAARFRIAFVDIDEAVDEMASFLSECADD